jgi:hypothetical protein
VVTRPSFGLVQTMLIEKSRLVAIAIRDKGHEMPFRALSRPKGHVYE